MTDAAASSHSERYELDSRLASILFGDRLGLLLFIASLAFVWLYWRTGVFITDTNTLTRALDAVAHGGIGIDQGGGALYSGPGAVLHEGVVYGRNYGQVFLALPFLWTIDALSTIANLRVALLAGWHLLLLGLLAQLGHLVRHRRRLVSGGSVLVLASFLLNVLLATSFGAVSTHLLALQLGSMVAGAAIAVLLYRVCLRHHGTRTALAAGAVGTLVLPIGFWAPIPKRHVLVGAILLAMLYLFDVSRSADARTHLRGVGPVPLYRAGTYALLGLLAWIHAAEALFVAIPLALVDLPTAPRNGARDLGFVTLAFLASLLPFFLTNWLISGDVLEPPRALSQTGGEDPRTTDFLQSADGPGDSAGGYPGSVLVTELLWLWSLVWLQIDRSLQRLWELDAVVSTWFRSGSLEKFWTGGVPQFRGTNLAVLESVPLFGGFLATVGIAAHGQLRERLGRVRATDALALGLVVSFILLYMQRLPLHVQVTVRFLVPIYPLLLFLLVRLAPIQQLTTDRLDCALWTYLGVVLIGSQLLLAWVVASNATISEAVQLHGLLGLGAAALLGTSVVACEFEDRFAPAAAVALGLAAGLGTVFILLSGLAYFSFIGEYVLPMSQAVADLIGRI